MINNTQQIYYYGVTIPMHLSFNKWGKFTIKNEPTKSLIGIISTVKPSEKDFNNTIEQITKMLIQLKVDPNEIIAFYDFKSNQQIA